MVDGHPDVDLDQMLDLATPWCLMVAATLRIPDLIAEGHHDVGDLAARASCDRDALHAVLDHLVSKGVFQQQAPGRFACNRAAEQLAATRFLDLDGIGGRFAHTWGTRSAPSSTSAAAPAPCWPRCCAATPMCAAPWSTFPARSTGPANS